MARDQGVDLEELDFEGTDLEKSVVNQGTNDAIVREFMARCRKDAQGLPHKTIVFAVSHAHAKVTVRATPPPPGGAGDFRDRRRA